MQDALRADHGFSMESKPVKEVLDIMNTFSEADRRSFLRFATGSPRLPVGGVSNVHRTSSYPNIVVLRIPSITSASHHRAQAS